jgi:hypothetical protein
MKEPTQLHHNDFNSDERVEAANDVRTCTLYGEQTLPSPNHRQSTGGFQGKKMDPQDPHGAGAV